ncbi:hypothetical protein [Streptomyces sp. NPDC048057]|uniref:hypothetical protein n=1 Tax=Streptomyces sp. NPDC048057 TaxID=3155628 RepID=UPI00340EFB7B
MAVLEPPWCPTCSGRPSLWKDTTSVVPARPDQWRWYCTGCRGEWEPTFEQRMKFTYGTHRAPRR